MRTREPVALPSGTVTLLLADVEGSTQMWQRDSAGAGSAMVALSAVVDELVTRFDGARPVEQGEGDSFVAGFARAADALACALALQQQLIGGPVRLRVALHTGDVVVRDGHRYDGPTIIRAARIRDLGHGGQTLISSTTRDLVLDTMSDDVGLIDVGSYALKGLDRPERVWQLTHPDLPATFPSLRSGGSKTASLPVHLSTFIGRTAELAEVRHLVRAERLVTLTGAGGCGKTRLAIEALREIADDFPDGAWFCDLGPLADPDLVGQALRTTMGLTESAEGDDVRVVIAQLSDAKAIVVLDNCEHLIAACSELTTLLLAGCHDLHVVATSREPLGLEGEVAWRVPSLAIPDTDPGSLQQLLSYDAIRLFVERSAKVRPNFVLDETNAQSVAEICRRLDGIPLAIELAAARVRVLSVPQIADGLNDRFRLLGRTSRTALERQQTLFASVGWSHDLLTNAQRTALRRLSIFAGGFALGSAEGIISFEGVERSEVLELVTQLVDRSLVVAEERPGLTRYRMLETIRQFARDRLVDSGEAVTVAESHLAWFADWAENLFGGLDPRMTDVRDLYARIIDDYDNIHAACEWALDQGHDETGLRLASALERFWNFHSTSREAVRWLETFLARAADAEPIVRARGLIALGSAREYFNDLAPAIDAAREALPLARDADDTSLLLRILLRLGMTAGMVSQSEGIGYLEEAIEIARNVGDDLSLSEAFYSIGQVYMFDARSLPGAREALRISLPYGDVVSARPRLLLAFCLAIAGELDDAIVEFTTARSIMEAIGDDWFAAACDGALGNIAMARGDLEKSRELLDGAIGWARSAARDDAIAIFAIWRAQLAFCEGDAAGAGPFVDDAWRYFVTFPGSIGDAARTVCDAYTAIVRFAKGDHDGARTSAASALAVPRTEPIGFWTTAALSIAARVLRTLGEFAAAETAATESARLTAELGVYASAPDVLDTAAVLRADVGAHADAARLAAAADAARERTRTVRLPDPVWDVDAEITAIRERLGTGAFNDAWAAGRELDLHEALEYALRGRGPRQRPQAGWDAITPTEMKVVELVAEGLSNPQIAERMFISRRTVSTHLSHIFAKVGVGSRAELAAEAAKRGQLA